MQHIGVAGAGTNLLSGIGDLTTAWGQRREWWMASVVAVGTRYRQTILGPWWSTLITAAFIFGLAVLRVGLGGGDLREAIPYVGLGFIIFGFVQGGVQAAASVFAGSGARLSSVARPLSFQAFRTQSLQLLDFAHDALVIILIAVIFAIPLTWEWSQSMLVVALILLGSLGMCLWLGPLVARFRDLQPIVTMVMRLAFFLTPIFWSIDELTEGRGAWAWWNPFTYLVLAFRDPILDQTHPSAPVSPLLFTALWAVGNVLLGLVVFVRTRNRIPYWAVE